MKRSLLTNGDNLPTSTGAVFDGSKPLITCQEKQTPPELKIETCAEFRSSNHEWNNIAIHPKLLPNPNFLRENRAFLLGIELGMVETLFESWRVPAPGWDRYGVVQFWIWIASYFLIQISWFLSKSSEFLWTLSPKISQTYTKSTAPHISGARTHGDWNRWCWWGGSTTSITGTQKRASIAFRATARGSHRRTTTLQLGWGWGNFGTKRETCEGRGKSQCWRDTLVTCPTSVFLKWGGVVMDVDVMVCCIRSWDGLECVKMNFLFITQAFWKLQCVFFGFQKM